MSTLQVHYQILTALVIFSIKFANEMDIVLVLSQVFPLIVAYCSVRTELAWQCFTPWQNLAVE